MNYKNYFKSYIIGIVKIFTCIICCLILFFILILAILDRVQTIDMSALCIHPTCVVSVLLTTLRIEPKVKGSTVRDNFLLNINGNLLLVNQQSCDDQVLFYFCYFKHKYKINILILDFIWYFIILIFILLYINTLILVKML